MRWFTLHKLLITQLLRRDIESRYRGSMLGILWSLITPMLMLAVYTFVFQTVFKSRWSDTAGDTQLGFAIVLFLGLSLHGLLTEILVKSPMLILGHQNFVKKIVFPLHILPCVNLLSASFSFAINFILLMLLIFIEQSSIPLTALFLPLILMPYLLLLLGLGWFLAALGVYLRDIQQVMGTLATLLLFLSPIFYPPSVLPESFSAWLFLNPLSLIVESSRAVLIYGQIPDFFALGVYFAIALIVAVSSYQFFRRVRPGFADVL
jgi:lipopolysaccharide transport system permease protein